MRAGPLRFRVRVDAPTESRNSVGEVEQTWSEYKTIWADIEPIRGTERLNLMQVQATVDVKIITRANAGAGITPKMRFVYGDRIFDIDAVIDMRSRGIMREFMCKEAA